jgi:hypothetical protein
VHPSLAAQDVKPVNCTNGWPALPAYTLQSFAYWYSSTVQIHIANWASMCNRPTGLLLSIEFKEGSVTPNLVCSRWCEVNVPVESGGLGLAGRSSQYTAGSKEERQKRGHAKLTRWGRIAKNPKDRAARKKRKKNKTGEEEAWRGERHHKAALGRRLSLVRCYLIGHSSTVSAK